MEISERRRWWRGTGACNDTEDIEVVLVCPSLTIWLITFSAFELCLFRLPFVFSRSVSLPSSLSPFDAFLPLKFGTHENS